MQNCGVNVCSGNHTYSALFSNCGWGCLFPSQLYLFPSQLFSLTPNTAFFSLSTEFVFGQCAVVFLLALILMVKGKGK
mgnify:CR=1 FL=1